MSITETISGEQLETLLKDAFKLYREGRLLPLSTSALADSDLVQPFFLSGEHIDSEAKARAMQGLLHWLVNRLKPEGEASWSHKSWQSYNVLYYFYFEGWSVLDLQHRLNTADQTIYRWRDQAIAEAAQLLGEISTRPEQYIQHKIIEQYRQLNGAEQRLLRMGAVFSQGIPAELLYHLASLEPDFEAHGMLGIGQALQRLILDGVVVGNDDGTEYLVAPSVRQPLSPLLSPPERYRWHSAAGEYYQQQGDYLSAGQHFYLAGNYEVAAHILINHEPQIAAQFNLNELSELLNQFRPHQINEPRLWSQLKLKTGQVTEFLGHINQALAQYQQALSASDIGLQAQAYYLRGRLIKLQSIDEALIHYSYGTQLLSHIEHRPPELTQLLIKFHIGQAWIYMSERPNSEQAQAHLHQAEAIVTPADRENGSDLHKAWGEYYHHQNDRERAKEHHLQAWLAANELQDVDRLIETGHDLGQAYMEIEAYEEALRYLQKSNAMAVRSGNRRMEGLNSLNLGACYFYLMNYAEAVTYYHQARDIFEAIDNENWLAFSLYNLAEAEAILGDIPAAQAHVKAGLVIAKQLGHTRLLHLFETLGVEYPWLKQAELNERQQKGLAYVVAHGDITNRGYRELCEVAQKTAADDLRELVEQGLLVKTGAGRSVKYLQP